MNNTLRGLIFCIALSVALAQYQACENLVDGSVPGTDSFSDPTYANGQAFGRFSYDFTDIYNSSFSNEYKYEGFLWPWSSRDFNIHSGGNTPVFLPNDLLWNFPAASYNGWEWGNNYNGNYAEMRTCGLDNETLIDGPGVISSNDLGWDRIVYPIYNVTFWQKAYVPSSPTANWARMVHYVQNPGPESIFMNYHATSYSNAGGVFVNRGSTDRFVVMSDVDQGVAYISPPTAINHMGQNGRLIVTQGYSYDCGSLGYSANFELGPGETVGIMMVYAMGMNITHALETAKWIDTNPEEIFAKLSTEDITTIMNWDACAAAHGSKVSVQITQSDKCSSSAAKMDISTTGTTLRDGDITHRVLNAAGEVVAQNVTTSVTLKQAGDYLLESWWNGCVVKRTSFSAVLNDAAWNAATGKFTGSNDPYTFVVGSASSVTITDKNGCSITDTLSLGGSAPTKTSSGGMVVPTVQFLVVALAFYLF